MTYYDVFNPKNWKSLNSLKAHRFINKKNTMLVFYHSNKISRLKF